LAQLIDCFYHLPHLNVTWFEQIKLDLILKTKKIKKGRGVS